MEKEISTVRGPPSLKQRIVKPASTIQERIVFTTGSGKRKLSRDLAATEIRGGDVYLTRGRRKPEVNEGGEM